LRWYHAISGIAATGRRKSAGSQERRALREGEVSRIPGQDSEMQRIKRRVGEWQSQSLTSWSYPQRSPDDRSEDMRRCAGSL
jgi:hypothetical protein